MESKEKYWEWRAQNNPFKNPNMKDHKPDFFEKRPGRRIMLIWIPLVIGNIAVMQWFRMKERRAGRGVFSVPLDLLENKPIKGIDY